MFDGSDETKKGSTDMISAKLFEILNELFREIISRGSVLEIHLKTR